MDTNETPTVKAPAHPVGRPRQGLNARLIFTQEPAKIAAVETWLAAQPTKTTISDFLREAFDDCARKHGITI